MPDYKPYAPSQSPEMVEASNEAKAIALRRVLKYGLLGLGSGAGLAAALGIPHAISHKAIPSYPLQTEIDLAYPQEIKKTAGVATDMVLTPSIAAAVEGYLGHKRRSTERSPKGNINRDIATGLGAGLMALPAGVTGALAGESLGSRLAKLLPPRTASSVVGRSLLPKTVGSLGSVLLGTPAWHLSRPYARKAVDKVLGPEKTADWADSSVSNLLSAAPGDKMPTVGSPAWMRGDSHTAPASIPWAIPATGAALAGGAVGGHQLVRYLLRKRRKADLDTDLQNAKKEYEESMLSQYDPSKLRSLSSTKEASADHPLDTCFTLLEKNGFDVNNALGSGAGLYGFGAGALATLSGLATYKLMRGRSGEKLLRDALKRRAMMRSLQNPPDMYIRPVPVEYVDSEKEK